VEASVGDYIIEQRLSKTELYMRSCAGATFSITASALKALVQQLGKNGAKQELLSRITSAFGDTITIGRYTIDFDQTTGEVTQCEKS
jgi:hypothetical protein